MANAPTLWQCDQADNILEASDLRSLAYSWDSIKLSAIGRIFQNGGSEWAAAADLCLWCLQADASRRPRSMQEVFAHKFFDATGGVLRFLTSATEKWDSLAQRQAAGLHAAIDEMDSTKVWALIDHGEADISMIDESVKESTVRPLHRAAFAGNAEVVRVLLAEVHDSARTCAHMHTCMHTCMCA